MANPILLIVEDNPTNRKLIEVVLRRSGFQTLSADCAENGIETALQHKPDLILMDIQMPGMDGLQAAQLLRANPLTAHIPIVALTASAIATERERALDAGCSGYIAKPINAQTFPEQVQTFLDKHA